MTALEVEAPRHSLFDDAQALVTGTLFVGLGLALFREAGLMTGGTVGLAFLAHYATGLNFGLLFFCINLPFYLLAWQRMGRRFTLKTLAAVSLLAALSEALPEAPPPPLDRFPAPALKAPASSHAALIRGSTLAASKLLSSMTNP